MRPCTRCHIDKPLEDYYKSAGYRDGHQRICKDCMTKASSNWSKTHKGEVAQRSRYWREGNPEKSREISRRSQAKRRAENGNHVRELDRNRARNKGERRAANQRYYERNKEKRKEYNDAYHANNPALKVARKAKRRAIEFQATPSWANDFFIKEIYRLAKLREKVTGGKWHVDHIVPLSSKLVCGLHVEANLQVIPAIENQRKHNSWWPDMPL